MTHNIALASSAFVASCAACRWSAAKLDLAGVKLKLSTGRP